MRLKERFLREVWHCQDMAALRGQQGQLVDALIQTIPLLDEATDGLYIIAGGLAAGVHSDTPVATADLDVIVEDPQAVASFIAKHTGSKVKSISEVLDQREGYSVQVTPGLWMDVLGISEREGLHDLESYALAHPDTVDVDGTEISIMSAEHLIVSKAVVGRDRDRLHITELVRSGHKEAALHAAEKFLSDDDLEDFKQMLEEIDLTLNRPARKSAERRRR